MSSRPSGVQARARTRETGRSAHRRPRIDGGSQSGRATTRPSGDTGLPAWRGHAVPCYRTRWTAGDILHVQASHICSVAPRNHDTLTGRNQDGSRIVNDRTRIERPRFARARRRDHELLRLIWTIRPTRSAHRASACTSPRRARPSRTVGLLQVNEVRSPPDRRKYPAPLYVVKQSASMDASAAGSSASSEEAAGADLGPQCASHEENLPARRHVQ
jgi:hypothetical protein